MKLLKVVFVILILVTFAELSYYLYLNFYLKPQTTTINADRVINVNGDRLVSDEIIGYLRSRKASKNQKFFLTEEVFGRINELFESSGELGIIIVDDNNERVLTFMRMHDGKTQYYKKVDDKKVSISYQDLNIGDKILFKSYTDLVTSNEINAEIIIE